jgi:dephospho-CoA kinase
MGSGKTTAAHFFAGVKDAYIDADSVAKEVMNRSKTLQEKIAAAFGPRFVQGGFVHSDELGRVVFGDLSELRKLNAIVHPALVAELEKSVKAAAAELCVVDAALLPLWHLEERFDMLLWVTAREDLRLSRLLAKLSLSEGQVRERMQMQARLMAPPRGKPWRTVENERSVQDLSTACEALRRTLIFN